MNKVLGEPRFLIIQSPKISLREEKNSSYNMQTNILSFHTKHRKTPFGVFTYEIISRIPGFR